MGLFGSLIGWDQHKGAYNAVLANYVAESASHELKREIANRIVIIQQQVIGRGKGDPKRILCDLSNRSRIIQMNFIALACNSLGIPPGLKGINFVEVENPYRSDNPSSLDRLDVCLAEVSRRSGRYLSWPGNHVRIDFVSWAGQLRSEVDPVEAADLAYRDLLLEVVERDVIEAVAAEMADSVSVRSSHELALMAAAFFFEDEDLIPQLFGVQLMARLNMLAWFEQGMIESSSALYFENLLYKTYKP